MPSNATAPRPPGPGPGYEEMLRAVGALLDRAGSEVAMLDVTARRVRVLAVGPFGEQELSLRYLRHCIQAQRQLRGRLAWRDPGDPRRLQPVLRAVGAELARQQASPYRLAVAPGAVVISGRRGYRRALALDALADLLRAALTLRTPPPSDP